MGIRKLFLREINGHPNGAGGLSPSPGGKLEEMHERELWSWGLWNDICLGNPALLLCLRPSLLPTHTPE